MNLDDRERDACVLLHEVLCAIRFLTGGGGQFGEEVRREVNLLADAAHNIPLALGAQESYRAMLDEEVARVKEVQRDFKSPPA